MKAAAERCAKELGGIDFLIAGAAGNFIAGLDQMSANAFKTVIDIDVIGTFNTIKATMPFLLKSKDARVIYVSATFHYTGQPLQGHVAAAKAAVDSLMATVALEYGPRGVQSNAIAPGPIAETEGMARLSSSNVAEQKDIARGVPSGRWGTVKDIADATVYLFSEAGAYVNGHVLVVDGSSWRRQAAMNVGLDAKGAAYPDFLVSGEISKFLKDPRKDKKAKL
jgi:peroxisomal 2,4-dienoyl-CoA reductase